MRLIKITHWRCNEPTATTYAFAPSEWSDEEIHQALDRAQNAYLDVSEHIQAHPDPPNDYRPGKKPPFEKHPNKTVQEVIDEWEEKGEAYAAWKKTQMTSWESFESFLKREGFTPLWEGMDSEEEFSLDWEHRHGQRIDYAESETDSLRSPAESLGRKPGVFG